MGKISQKTWIQVALASIVLFATSVAPASAITLTQISTAFPSAIGIDYYEPTNEVVMSVNYFSGTPENFKRVSADGTQTSFSTVSGFTDEVKIATVRSTARGGSASSIAQGFVAGDLFTGNGIDGEIVRITGTLGGTVINPWVSLPGAGNGLMRGSLYIDRTGVWGGDLIAVTTNGEVWRVSCTTPACTTGTPTLVADVATVNGGANIHLEGMITVPSDVAKYGPLAGRIIAGAEGQSRLYAIDTTGDIDFYTLSVAIEDIDLIPANENFFGVNYGTSKLLGAPASDFDSMEGDILLTQEFGGGPSGLFRLSWNGTSLVTTALTLDAGSATPGQWEHVTFAPAGVVEIPPTVPEPATLILLGSGLAGLAAWRVRKEA
jgi:hypothetical protein